MANNATSETPAIMGRRHRAERKSLRELHRKQVGALLDAHAKQTEDLEAKHSHERRGGYKQSDAQILDPED
jgi:hypothetical protein